MRRSKDPCGAGSALGGVRAPTILKPAPSCSRGRGAGIPAGRASEPAVGATYRANAPVSRTKSASRFGESLAAEIYWVTEFILTYDGKPSYTVSIMEFSGEKVARETQYFADPFPAPAFRAQWVERMDS